MIKINLAKGKKVSSSSGEASPAMGIDSGSSSDIQRQGLTRLVIIGLLPLALYAYEAQNIPELQGRLQSKQNLLQTLTDKNSQAKGAVEEIKKFKEDQAQLQNQISTLEGLRKERLTEVKILDSIQKEMPDKLWLTKISFEQTKLALSGLSVGDLELSTFMEQLSRSIFLKKVNLIRSSDVPNISGLQTKSFEINCDLEDRLSSDGKNGLSSPKENR